MSDPLVLTFREHLRRYRNRVLGLAVLAMAFLSLIVAAAEYLMPPGRHVLDLRITAGLFGAIVTYAAGDAVWRVVRLNRALRMTWLTRSTTTQGVLALSDDGLLVSGGQPWRTPQLYPCVATLADGGQSLVAITAEPGMVIASVIVVTTKGRKMPMKRETLRFEVQPDVTFEELARLRARLGSAP